MFFPVCPCPICQRSERDNSIDLIVRQNRLDPLISIGGDRRIVLVFASAPLSIDAVQERIDHGVAAINSELEQESLKSMTGDADQNPPDYGFGLGGVLSDHQHSS